MKYHYKPRTVYKVRYGKRYECDHPVYNDCTLYLNRSKGLAVIQQRYNPKTKTTWWGPIDDCLIDELYLNTGFKDYFNKYANHPDSNGLYFTVTVRQIMWALRMRPLAKSRWETTFDHKDI